MLVVPPNVDTLLMYAPPAGFTIMFDALEQPLDYMGCGVVTVTGALANTAVCPQEIVVSFAIFIIGGHCPKTGNENIE